MKSGNWMQMLEQLETALHQISADAEQQEAALASPLLADDADNGKFEEWAQRLDDADQRLKECEAYVAEAGKHTDSAQGELAVREEEIRQYHIRLKELRQKLASVPVVAIE
jgi:chromosome segregation ATPase